MGHEGVGHEVKGTIKEQVGQVTGNRSQQVEGNVEKNVGKAEQMIDAMTDRMRGNTDKR
ncbi:MAG TPA: CsbD family protein [Luteimonas sp.]|nr:CsbD family protein [Luteimonas sp.]